MAYIGYARISTSRQNTDFQRNALTEFGCERIFEEKASGARTDRPELKKLLDHVRAGDTVVVWRLDRLGRSLSHVVQTAEDLHKRGVMIRGLKDNIDPTGKMIAVILAVLAKYERDLIAERAQVAREVKQQRSNRFVA